MNPIDTRVLVALAACGLSICAGCYRDTGELGPPERPMSADLGPPQRPGYVAPAPLPAPSAASPAFEDAVARLRAEVRHLRTVAADDAGAQQVGIRRALRYLADAVEEAPTRSGRATITAAAAEIRSAEARMALSLPAGGDASLAAKEALGAVADALVGLARGPYRRDAEVVSRIFELDQHVRAINDRQTLRTPPGAIVDALHQALGALEAMRDAPAR